ncbi:MAG: hypothetical protein NVSMB51_08370 [Solirubrobacteraceae bacterium]
MPRAPDLTGRVLEDRYELQALIGEGTFGRVYRGFDRRLARTVAVKVIKPWWAEDPEWVARFEGEARLLARLSDPGIVRVYDISESPDGLYYVAELVEGESLAELLHREGPLAPERARRVAEQLCGALAQAHAQGIVHRDIKPANILLPAVGPVKVGDFGVARLTEGSSFPGAATAIGTPQYMSPEQARGEHATAASDVYASGVVLYEMLTGRTPFAGKSALELALAHIQDQPPPLPAGVPPDLGEVLRKALSKVPEERFAEAGAMAAALAAASAHSSGPTARPVPAAVPSAAQTVRLDPETVAAPRSRPRPAAPRRSAGRRLAALALLLAAFGLVLGRLGGTGGAVVPSVLGLPRGGVEARAARAHLRVAFAARYSDFTRGRAIEQLPGAGAHAARGSALRVTLSLGPAPVAVPDLRGRGRHAAQTALRALGLRSRTSLVASPAGAAPYSVISQRPSPPARAVPGSTVRLLVAEPARLRRVTSFSGPASAAFRIRGRRWRLRYTMRYDGRCLLVLVCFGPKASVSGPGGARVAQFDLSEGSGGHSFESAAPGVYRVTVTQGRDRAHWHFDAQDFY